MESGCLFVVATPIGNLDDLSPRARRILSEVDFIAAEDTRRSGRLLSHFGIETPVLPLHEHNEREAAPGLVTRMLEGSSIALISDAGTPLLSDPGFRLVREAHRAGLRISPVPGPGAAAAGLCVSGLPTDRYCFEGFLPARRSARRDRLTSLSAEPRSMIFFEAVHRIAATLADLAELFGADRPAFLGRELTKLHEECIAATLGELRERVEHGGIVAKGEFVLVVGGNETPPPAGAISPDRLLEALVEVLPGREAAAIVARLSDLPRNAVYRRMLALTGKEPPL